MAVCRKGLMVSRPVGPPVEPRGRAHRQLGYSCLNPHSPVTSLPSPKTGPRERLMRALLAGAFAALAASCSTSAPAPTVAALTPQPLPPVTVAHADYANPSLWLCRPGLADDKCKI